MPLDLVPHAEMHPAFVLGKIPSMKPWVWEFSKKFTKNLAVAKHGMKLSDLGMSALAIVSLSDPRPAHQIPPLPVRPLPGPCPAYQIPSSPYPSCMCLGPSGNYGSGCWIPTSRLIHGAGTLLLHSFIPNHAWKNQHASFVAIWNL